MKTKRCLYCYNPLEDIDSDFHKKCSIRIFGSATPPTLDFTLNQMKELASQIVIRSITLTGVQSKLSLAIEAKEKDPKTSRFTIVGLWGDYILKPPSSEFNNLPENEDLTMHLAGIFNIITAEHSLIRLASGELAYITKRFDRVGNEKIAMEDMCQLTETLTSDKYRGSMEKIGKHVDKYSSQAGLDKITLFEVTLFSFLIGNADMHLKNFALLTKENAIQLSPAYDLVNTKLAMPEDLDELALTLNGKMRKIRKTDFDQFAANLGISEKVLQQSYNKFSEKLNDALAFIKISFLNETDQEKYIEILNERAKRFELI